MNSLPQVILGTYLGVALGCLLCFSEAMQRDCAFQLHGGVGKVEKQLAFKLRMFPTRPFTWQRKAEQT